MPFYCFMQAGNQMTSRCSCLLWRNIQTKSVCSCECVCMFLCWGLILPLHLPESSVCSSSKMHCAVWADREVHQHHTHSSLQGWGPAFVLLWLLLFFPLFCFGAWTGWGGGGYAGSYVIFMLIMIQKKQSTVGCRFFSVSHVSLWHQQVVFLRDSPGQFCLTEGFKICLSLFMKCDFFYKRNKPWLWVVCVSLVRTKHMDGLRKLMLGKSGCYWKH